MFADLAPTFAANAAARGIDPARPLGFPAELWSEMTEQHRAACTSAQALLAAFGSERTLPLRSASRRAGLALAEALEGLRVLDGMDLVQVQPGDDGPLVTLVALPDDHVRIIGPDGGVRWVFIARPLDAPELEPSELN
jgi:hypothetical protein